MKRKHTITRGSDTQPVIYSTKTTPTKHPYTGKDYRYDVRLFHSKCDPAWSEKARGKLAARAVDNGNGVTIHIDGNTVVYDYLQVEYLQLLFRELAFLEQDITRVRTKRIN